MGHNSFFQRRDRFAGMAAMVSILTAWQSVSAEQQFIPQVQEAPRIIAIEAFAQEAEPDQAEGGPGKKATAKKADEKEKAKTENESNPPVREANAPPIDPQSIKLHLMDGSLISGKLAIKELAVETEYGSLSIPVSSIRSLTPGLSSHPAFSKQVGGWIQALGSANFNEREKAQQQLERYPALRSELEKFSRDTDTERRNRVTAILNKFEEDAEDEGADKAWGLRDKDVIETVEFTIVGKIVPQSFHLESQYGPLDIRLSDIRGGMRESSKKEDLRQTVSVDAQHFAFKSPLDTKIRLERGDKVTITAEGTIRMNPWGNNAMTTPEGNPQYGQFMGNQIGMGALVGRVGNSDQFTKFGNKFTLTVDKPGTLQLALGIMNDYQESQFPGKYTVKIHVVKKPETK